MKSRLLVLGSAIATIPVVAASCASPLPQYEWHDATTAVRTMSRRDGTIQTISATCRILLESEGGRVELTGALVARPPNRLRLRAWKFSQAVFDITLNEDGLFVLDRDHSPAAGKKLQRVKHARFVEAIGLLPGFGYDAALQTGAGTRDTFTLTRPLPDGDTAVECIVDKNTLVRTRCIFRDDGDHLRQSLEFHAYALFGDAVWPMRVDGTGKQGSFALSFDRVDVNVELVASAFEPPRRAVKQP